MKIWLTLSLLTTAALAADPEYFKSPIKGFAHVDTFTRASYTFTPGRIENCKDSSTRIHCDVKEGSMVFEHGAVRGEFIPTAVSIFPYQNPKYPELPDSSFIFKGTYTDNLPSDGQKFSHSMTIAVKGDAITGSFRTYDSMYGTDVTKLFFFGKK